ncbi:MAG: hypothetical protein ACM3ME_04765 [Chloroflexota bacterium]|nr:hypothetical protein [Lentimicrobium sp.]
MFSHYHFLKEVITSSNTYSQETELIRDFFNDPFTDVEEFIAQTENGNIKDQYYESHIRLTWSKIGTLN